ncbi:MAG: transglycosylase domain-containing protein [Gemmatimonadota bacterium]|jgi:penicillin-binding protein 1A
MGKKRSRRKGRGKKPRSGRLARWAFAGAAGALLALVVATTLLTPDCADEGCPTLASVEAYRPPEPPRVYDRTGRLVGQLPGPRRLVVSLREVSPLVRNGFVAVEDRRFFHHDGVDVLGVLRALVRNARAGGVEEGASTITMQLVRNVFEADVHDYNRWRRKLTEARMALALEDRLSKDRILELYLNQIYLGDGVWGVETAARDFFGKPAAEVGPAEAALLVGLAKNPEGYNPRRHPERAVQRRNVVLDILEREGLLSPAEAEEARAAPLDLASPRRAGSAAVWYMAAVDRRLRELFPDPRERHGLRVHTGYDPPLQATAVQALGQQIAAIEAGTFGPWRHEAPGEGKLQPVRGRASPYLQGMVVALEPSTGEVLALVGGRDFGHSEYDRAFQARRQPGSAFKPLVYSVALQRGLSLSDPVATDPVVVRQAGGEPWSPRDAGDGEPLTVREALARSSNAAAVRVGRLAGLDRVISRARNLGITTPIPRYPSIFLGSAEVVPAELTAAYAAFGNGGLRVVPHLVTRIEDASGETVWEPENIDPEPAMDPAVAWLTLEALRGVIDGGTGWRARQDGYRGPAAGKTGTTDEGRDAWFVGLTPDLVAGVWLGFDAPRTIVPGGGGGALAAPVWGHLAAAARAASGSGTPAWSRPPGVVEATIDRSTGQLAGEHCPGELVVTEYFLEGTAPRERCPIHQGGLIDRIISGVKDLFGG